MLRNVGCVHILTCDQTKDFIKFLALVFVLYLGQSKNGDVVR